MSDADVCANCGRAIDVPGQKFCPACGQATPFHRIDWRFMAHEFEHSVLHMDRGVLYSLKQLMVRPGHLIRDCLEGRRARQARPLPLLMIMAALVVLAGKYLVGGDLAGAALAPGSPDGGLGGAAATQATAAVAATYAMVSDGINRHYAAATLILLPLEALALRLAFRGMGLNYPEWLVATAFLTAQAFVFMLAALLLQRWVPQARAWALLFALAWAMFALVQLFPGYPRWKSALRGMLGMGMFLVAQFVLTVAVVLVLLVLHRGG